MDGLKKLKTAGKVSGTALYHLTAGAFIQPKASLAFVETLVNAIVDFDYPPDPRLPQATLEELFRGISVVQFSVPVEPHGNYELPADEYRYMAGLIQALKPRRAFEIGTNHGRTTRLIAELAPEDAKIYTLDLPQESMLQGKHFSEARVELIGDAFRDHPVRSKITQLYGNSLTFDFSPYAGQMDLVFIDGDHSYQVVKSDTEQAFRMLAPGGIILWDDYVPRMWGIHVMRWLHELARTTPIYRLHNTRLAFYQAPKNTRGVKRGK